MGSSNPQIQNFYNIAAERALSDFDARKRFVLSGIYVLPFKWDSNGFTKRMVEGKLVRLEFDPLSSRRSDGKDRYSRTLAYVFLQDGRHLNAEIIRQGYGFAVSSSPPLKYQNEFRRLEGEAREQRRGLWASH